MHRTVWIHHTAVCDKKVVDVPPGFDFHLYDVSSNLWTAKTDRRYFRGAMFFLLPGTL